VEAVTRYNGALDDIVRNGSVFTAADQYDEETRTRDLWREMAIKRGVPEHCLEYVCGAATGEMHSPMCGRRAGKLAYRFCPRRYAQLQARRATATERRNVAGAP
jgi:hypothetical protein